MVNIYSKDFQKPILAITNFLTKNHNSTLGILFDTQHNDKHGYPESYLYYDVADIYDFVINKRIPVIHSSKSVYTSGIEEEVLDNLFSHGIAYFDNINNDHHNELFFTTKRGKCLTSDTICKELYPDTRFTWGAGWELRAGGISKNDTNREVKTIKSKNIQNKIKEYLKNPELFIKDVDGELNIIHKRKEKLLAENIEKRKIRLENEDIKYALPMINEVSIKEHENKLYLVDNRFYTKQNKVLGNLNIITQIGNADELQNKSKRELYTYSYNSKKILNDYIIDISRKYDLPFYKDTYIAWDDIYLDKTRKENITNVLDEEIEKAVNSTYSSTYNPISLNDYITNEDLDNTNYHNIEAMKEIGQEIPLTDIVKFPQVNLEDFLDPGETTLNYVNDKYRIDSLTKFYKGKLEKRDCFFLETMGETFIFMKDVDSSIILNRKEHIESLLILKDIENATVVEIEKYILKNSKNKDKITLTLNNYKMHNPHFEEVLNSPTKTQLTKVNLNLK